MEHIFNDTIPVREGEELDKNKLMKFISENISDIPDGDLEIEQFGSGHSNLTYLLKINNWEAVLRRPPHGPIAPKAHDMERENKFLSIINPYFPIAPQPYVYSEDESIVGSEFFIMERRKGIVLDTEFPEGIAHTKEIGKNLSQQMVEQLVALHSIDYKKTDLVNITKPEGFMERQVHGWIKRYERSKTDDVPNISEVISYLEKEIPQTKESTVIHYDYKLNNAMFSKDLKEMVGLFDWEMSTVGPPLLDLAVTMSYWIEEKDNDVLKYGMGKPPVTVLDGFYTRNEFIEEYGRLSNRDVSNISYYLTFAYFKLAVIGQQIYYRYKQGQTKDERFAKFHILINNMVQEAYKGIQ